MNVAPLEQTWPALLLGLPLAAALLAYLLPRLAAPLGVAACLGNAVVAGALAWRVVDAGPLRHAVGGWQAPLGIGLRVDGLAATMLLATAAVAAMAAPYATAYFRGHHGGAAARGFWPLWLLLLGALNALFTAADLFNIYVTLELAGLAAVALVTLNGDSTGLGAALRYLLVGLTGSLCYLLGVGLLYAGFGSIDLPLLAEAGALLAALALMSAGLLFKAGLFPFHFWLPPAHASAPAPVSAMLSALVVEAAFYLLLRLWLELAPAATAEAALWLFALLGGAAVLWGGVNALLAARLKLMVAYSTVAQLGYLFLALPLMTGTAGAGAWSGAALLVLAHALAKAALFLAAGNVLLTLGHDHIDRLDGTAQRLPLTTATLILAAVSLIGLPPSGGFLAKWLLLNAALGSGAWWTVAVLLTGSVLAGAYLFRVIGRAFAHLAAGGDRRPVAPTLDWPPFLLAAAALLLGLAGGLPATLATVGSPFDGPLLHESAP